MTIATASTLVDDAGVVLSFEPAGTRDAPGFVVLRATTPAGVVGVAPPLHWSQLELLLRDGGARIRDRSMVSVTLDGASVVLGVDGVRFGPAPTTRILEQILAAADWRRSWPDSWR